jgi:hypothetical protein
VETVFLVLLDHRVLKVHPVMMVSQVLKVLQEVFLLEPKLVK